VTPSIHVGEELIVHQSLDTGAELPPCPAPMAPQTIDADYARTVAAVLLAFLNLLPESVVPLSLHQRCSEITSRDEALEVRYDRSCCSEADQMTYMHVHDAKTTHVVPSF
jgi:hypothetical protein